MLELHFVLPLHEIMWDKCGMQNTPIKRHRLSLDVPDTVKARLERIKKREQRGYTEIIRRALEAYEAAYNYIPPQ